MKLSKFSLLIIFYYLISLPVLTITAYNTDAYAIIIPVYLLISTGFTLFIASKAKKTYKSYYESERTMLYSMLEDLNALIVIWSDKLDSFTVNDCFYIKTGYRKNDLKDKKSFLNIFSDGKAFNPENALGKHCAKIQCKDKSSLKIQWNTTVLKDNNRKIYLSVGMDVTDAVHMEKMLSVSEKKMELAMELSEIGLIFRSIDSGNYFISENLMKLLGFSQTSIAKQDFEKLIHEEDIYLYNSYTLGHTNELSVSNDLTTSIELRLMCVDGYYHWFNYRFKYTNLVKSRLSAIGGCLIDISKEKEKDSLIEKMAYIDETTQIFNRNKFMMLGKEIYSCSKELGISYWLIVFDVDSFHLINDTCGYENGGKLLKDIALTIIKCSYQDSFCARIGGDNFAVLLRDYGENSDPVTLIKNIQHGISKLNTDVFSNQHISASAGYCKLPSDGTDFSKVLEHAEFALQMGENKRSNIVSYDIGVHDKIIERSSMEKELEKAIDNNQLKLLYQPKINLSDNTIVGAEALIRWIKQDGTMVSPCDFIPIAESSSLITRISEFVIKEACRQNKLWQDSGLPPLCVSVNLSSVDFYQTDVCQTIKNAITSTGLKPEWLEVELTETLALKDVDHAIRQMNELNEIGVKISMDDFGTGYSSLSYIQVLPITMLKLDRSFIMNLVNDKVSRQIVSSVINICKSKDIKIIAEGIENKDQAEILRSSGCDQAQGYYFGKPMTSKNLEYFLKKAI